MSSGESDSSEPANVSATPTMSSRETAASVMLTDSENTNNENRVIEMESNPGAEDTEGAPSEEVERANASTTEPDASVPEEKAKDEPGTKQQSQPDDSDTSNAGKDQYAEHVTYNETGEAIYTDPATKFQYRWCKEKSEWVPRDGTATPGTAADAPSDNPYENEHYRWCHEKKEWIPKQENPTETEFYRWDEKEQKWVPKQQQPASEEDREYGYEDGVHTYKDKDGAVYFWDDERKAWFPKVDDDFMAMYQLNYGFIDNTSSGSASGEGSATARPFPVRPVNVDDVEEQDESQRAVPKGKKRKAPPEPPKWFELAPEHNTKVYVSNLPTDISEEEFGEVMSKCGMVMKDPKTHKLKLKLYREADGTLKGDGLCHYIKVGECFDLFSLVLKSTYWLECSFVVTVMTFFVQLDLDI
uniref:RRM domain-containing protein n=1 Tax=Anopheles culicifacies TaxID=139723 RepID=A0A182MW65_9DIPT